MIEAADRIVLRGCVELALKNAVNGETLARVQNRNAVMTVGRAWLLQHMLSGDGATSQTLQQVALGTDTTAPATSDTGLGSELSRKIVGTWDTSGLTATAAPYFIAEVDFATNEANGTLAEIGLFNSTAAGTMLAHATFSTFAKTTSNTLGVSYTISG